MYEQEIIISGGANSDDDARSVPQGWYRELWYARLGDSVGNGFCIVTAQGTRLVINSGISWLDQVIGAKEWVEGESVIYFVWKENSNHEIWRFNVVTESHTLIVADPIFNFQKSFKINHIITGINNLVIWTDRYWDNAQYNVSGSPLFNEPFYIDVKKFEDGEYPTPLTLQDVQFVKWPFWSGPTVEYFTDATKGDNKLRNKLLRFRATPIYWNNEEAAYSGYSKLVTPSVSEFVSGTNVGNSQADNGINITIETGPKVIRKINVAVSINGSQFGVFMQIDKDILGIADDTFYTFPYYGNASLLPIPLNTRNEDIVPYNANSCALLPTKEVAFVGYRTGRNIEAMDVTITPIYNEVRWVPIIVQPDQILFDYNTFFIGAFIIQLDVSSYTYLPFSVADAISAQINDGSVLTYYITEEDIANALLVGTVVGQISSIIQVVGDFFASQLGGLTVPGVVSTPGSFVRYDGVGFLSDLTSLSVYGSVGRRTLAQEDHIKGSRNQYGIQYYDQAGRAFTVWENEDLLLYVPFYSEAEAIAERAATFSDVNNPYTVDAEAAINHIPPLGAYYYRFVRRNTTDISTSREETVVAISQASNGRINLRLQSDPAEADNYQNTYTGASINAQIQKGDKCRFFRKRTDNVASPVPLDSPYVESYFELEVMEYDPTNQIITVENFDVSLIDFVASTDVGQSIQIYTPQPTLDTNGNLFVAEWQELSQVYEIGLPNTENRYHKAIHINGIADIYFDGTQNVYLYGNYTQYIGSEIIIENNTFAPPFIQIGVIDTASYIPGPNPVGTEGTTLITISGGWTQVGYISVGGSTFDLVYGSDQEVDALVSLAPAVIEQIKGPVWHRQRLYSTGHPALNVNQYYFINDPWYSDYWVESKLNDNGRIAVQSNFSKMIYKMASAIHGGAFIDNTQINNICVFEYFLDSPNIKEMDDQYGEVVAAIVDGKTLKCLQKRKENSIYINYAGYTISTDAGDVIPQQGRTFSQWRPYDSLFGCSDAGSVILIPGRGIGYFDRISACFILSLNNGQMQISNYIQGDGGLNQNFKYRTRTLELLSVCNTYDTDIVSYVDETNGEVGWGFISEQLPFVTTAGILADDKVTVSGNYTQYVGQLVEITPPIPDVPYTAEILSAAYTPNVTVFTMSAPTPKNTASAKVVIQGKYIYNIDVFDYVKMVWRSRYDYPIQRFASLGTKLISFSGETKLYVHNDRFSLTFNGTVPTEKWKFVTNADSNLIKIFRNLTLKSNKKWTMSSAITENNLSYSTQETSLSQDEFSVKEGVISARIKRDKNSPNFATTAAARIRGNEMRGQAMTVTIEREIDGKTITYSAKVIGEISEVAQ